MYTIYNSLTGSNESYGINFLKVFCDSVMIGVRCFDPDHDTYHGHILFEKLNYNYTDGVMSESKAAMLNMGELAADPTSYASNGFVDVFFNTSKKEVMLFTLSSLENSFVPYIYNYNINEHILKKIYPILSEDVDNWQTSNFGALVTNQPPLLSITDNKADLVVATTKNNQRLLKVLNFTITEALSLVDATSYIIPNTSNHIINKVKRYGSQLNFIANDDEDYISFKIEDK